MKSKTAVPKPPKHDAHEALDRSEFVQSDYSILWSSLVRVGIFIETFE